MPPKATTFPSSRHLAVRLAACGAEDTRSPSQRNGLSFRVKEVDAMTVLTCVKRS
jgi:hypothetical protein